MDDSRDVGRATASSATFPWGWRCDPDGWFESLVRPLIAWQPDPKLALDVYRIKLALAEAIDRSEQWLRHPCINPLTLQYRESFTQRTFQLAVWTAAHSETELGTVTLLEPTQLWTMTGNVTIDRGTHLLRDLAAIVRDARAPVAIPLDVWCGSVGYAIEDSWAAGTVDQTEEAVLGKEIVEYCRAIERIRRCLPETLEWISAATAVVVPMRNPGLGIFRSGSQATLPGLVWTDLCGGNAQILETVVHETAHNHLYTAEVAGPLVDPDHQGRYSSPLRPEPRPLRGILLACHALAYMTAAFADGRRAGYFECKFPENTFADLEARRDHASRTLVENRQHLTQNGRDFLDRTLEVCAYAQTAA